MNSVKPSRQPGLCITCRHGQVMEHGTTITTLCHNLHPVMAVRAPVTRCTDYKDRRHESEHHMRQIAWTISTDKKGHLGFRPPKKPVVGYVDD